MHRSSTRHCAYQHAPRVYGLEINPDDRADTQAHPRMYTTSWRQRDRTTRDSRRHVGGEDILSLEMCC